MPDAMAPVSPTKARIIAAADQVIREHGLVNTTTKLIAKAAGCSEALLYKHYADKNEIILAVMAGRASGFPAQAAALMKQVGEGDHEAMEERLARLVAAAIGFYRQGMPVGTALLNDPALLARHRGLLAQRGVGPRLPVSMLTNYLVAEQEMGRIVASADPETIAALLLGGAFHRAFLDALLDDSPARVEARTAQVHRQTPAQGQDGEQADLAELDSGGRRGTPGADSADHDPDDEVDGSARATAPGPISVPAWPDEGEPIETALDFARRAVRALLGPGS